MGISNSILDIFQAEHLQSKPCIEDVQEELNVYAFHSEHLDKEFSYEELTLAINNIGRGVGLDGLEKAIVHIFPSELRTALLRFFNIVYKTEYPDEWRYGELLYHLFYLKFMIYCLITDLKNGTR